MWLDSDNIGIIGCLVAIVGFGTQGIFVKSKKVVDAEIHPLLIAFLYSFCIAIIGIIIALVSMVKGNTLITQHWYHAGYASIAFAPGNLLLLWSCRRIGVGFAVGVVASTATISSYLIGTLQGDSFKPSTQIPGVLLMVLGTVLVSATKIPVFEDWIDPIPQHLLVEVLGESPDAVQHMNQIPSNSFNSLRKPLVHSDNLNLESADSEVDESQKRSEELSGSDRTLSSEALAAANLADLMNGNQHDSDVSDKDAHVLTRWSGDSGLTTSSLISSDPGQDLIRKTDPGPVRGMTEIQKLSLDCTCEEAVIINQIRSAIGHSTKHGGGTLFVSNRGATILEHRLRRKKRYELLRLSQHIIDQTSRVSIRPESRSAFVAAVLEATEQLDLEMDWYGLMMALFSGIFLGIQGIIFSNVIQFNNMANQLAIFLFIQFIITFIILLPFFIYDVSFFKSNISSPISLSLRYALCGGICFCCAVTGQVLGVLNLPVNVAMPLTQLNIIIAGIWSIFYFKEVESNHLIAVFLIALVIDLVGALLIVM
mmetsp:Transcript_6257/g.8075  ORF Transcript_6257/g.8075 Transcript_6257/m.8075 type:complete len:538 (-) Transcript_6257:298-1911(-)